MLRLLATPRAKPACRHPRLQFQELTKQQACSSAVGIPNSKDGNKPPSLPFPLHDVDPHLIQQCLGPRTPRTSPNRSTDASRTFAQLRRKVPIGYHGVPHIRPKNYPFPSTDLQPQYLPHPWTRPTYHHKPHPDPIRRFFTMHGIDTQAWLPGKFDD